MPHIHRLYDWVVSIFIVHRDRVLLCWHKKYREWLPVGGHVDLDEDPEQALFKEIREECGLKVRILAERPSIAHPGVKPVYTPSYVDVHRIKGVHKHIALIYFGVSASSRVKLHEREHAAYKWLSEKELADPKLDLTRSIRFYCRQALKAARRTSLLLILGLGLCVAAPVPLHASDIAYRVTGIFGKVELFEAITGAPQSFKTGQWVPVGSVVRTGSDGSVDLAIDPYFENVLRIGPDSQVTFLSFLPVRIALDEGTLFVLKEEQPGEIRILTRHFLASLQQGGCILEATPSGVTLKAFSESVHIQPKAAESYSQVSFAVEEGFRYSKEGWERLTYPDYAVWQAWYKENNNRKDRAVPAP